MKGWKLSCLFLNLSLFLFQSVTDLSISSKPPQDERPTVGSCLRCAKIEPSCLSLSSFFSQFDRIWWFFFLLGFVSFVLIYWEMILYIYLEAEKMWTTNKKCVFYSIFKNTTKHQKKNFQDIFWNAIKHLKIFLFPKNIFTWKYFTPEKYFTLKQTQP